MDMRTHGKDFERSTTRPRTRACVSSKPRAYHRPGARLRRAFRPLRPGGRNSPGGKIRHDRPVGRPGDPKELMEMADKLGIELTPAISARPRPSNRWKPPEREFTSAARSRGPRTFPRASSIPARRRPPSARFWPRLETRLQSSPRRWRNSTWSANGRESAFSCAVAA
jgi:hypothetical protein